MYHFCIIGSYVESVLDELYGNIWRANQNSVLPKSEPRKQNKFVLTNFPQTER